MRFTFLVAAFLLSACSSVPVHQALERVHPGMDKASVLDSAGDPKRTYREAGEDHWIYVYFEGGHELSREVVFESGRVIRITRARGKANWDKEIEAATKGTSASGPADAGFKSIDGGK